MALISSSPSCNKEVSKNLPIMNLKSLVTVMLSALISLPVVAANYEQRVFFKSAAPDRIFVYQADKLDEKDAKQKAMEQPYTAGKMTAVYIYGPNKRAPGNVLNTYKDIFEVNDALDEATDIDAWDYVLMRGRKGEVIWVDCNAKKTDDLCRQQQ